MGADHLVEGAGRLLHGLPGGKPPANSVAGKDNAAVIVSLVNGKEGTIGYVDLGDAKGYPSARIQNAKGEFVAPSSASAAQEPGQPDQRRRPTASVALNYKVQGGRCLPGCDLQLRAWCAPTARARTASASASSRTTSCRSAARPGRRRSATCRSAARSSPRPRRWSRKIQ